jgi:hypothetical protein
LNPCLHLERVSVADPVTCGRTRKEAADLRIQFPVVSGRYPSIFGVMRDIHGITGGQDYNHLPSVCGPRECSDHLGVDSTVAVGSGGNAQPGVIRRLSSLHPDRADVIDNERAFVAGQIQPLPKGSSSASFPSPPRLYRRTSTRNPVRGR